MLCHTTPWSLSSRCVFGKILDNCWFLHYLCLCKFGETRVLILSLKTLVGFDLNTDLLLVSSGDDIVNAVSISARAETRV